MVWIIARKEGDVEALTESCRGLGSRSLFESCEKELMMYMAKDEKGEPESNLSLLVSYFMSLRSTVLYKKYDSESPPTEITDYSTQP